MEQTIAFLKKITISSRDLNDCKKQLSSISNLHHPYLISFIDQLEIDIEFLSSLESLIISQIGHPHLPYPVYFYCKIKSYRGKIKTIANEKEIPRFYFRKEKKPNRQQSNMLAQTHINENDFRYIEFNSIKPILEKYKADCIQINQLQAEYYCLVKAAELNGVKID